MSLLRNGAAVHFILSESSLSRNGVDPR
jgi:hypothetical protein